MWEDCDERRSRGLRLETRCGKIVMRERQERQRERNGRTIYVFEASSAVEIFLQSTAFVTGVGNCHVLRES